MVDVWVGPAPRSWAYLFAMGVLGVFIGALLFLEPALAIRLLVYSLGIVAVVVAVLFFAGAAFFSRGGGPLVPLLLAIGALVLAIGVLALLNPGLVGGFVAVIAAALLIVGGLGMAGTAVFQRASLAGRVLSAGGGVLLAVLGLLFLFHAAFTASLVVRLVGIFLMAAGVVSLAGSLVRWWRERRAQPRYIDAELVEH
ncbi:MAG: hypothetical protein A4E39_01152 [Methanoregulaceae archaeon PtaB.Bin152]|nr:MAG: hypothetical protein A4E39_01152 [Methanoregulaceae archaeon PtaB.Bin152]OPY42712.1 MAG: hypothetical protein A4E41_00149 [Methanoregulaceae archaeon PtaU1.Bin066]